MAEQLVHPEFERGFFFFARSMAEDADGGLREVGADLRVTGQRPSATKQPAGVGMCMASRSKPLAPRRLAVGVRREEETFRAHVERAAARQHQRVGQVAGGEPDHRAVQDRVRAITIWAITV